MKEKIFKLLNAKGEDLQIGRELMINAGYSDFIRLRGKKELYKEREILIVPLDDVENLLNNKFNREAENGEWSGIWFYKDELL